MKPTTRWITGVLVIAVVIYVLSPGPKKLIGNPVGWEFREQFVYLTGVSALSLMVLSMVISLRIPWVNRRMHGLDKAYVIHKWTGIFTTLFIGFHWLGEKVPEWMVESGFIPNPGDLDDGSGFSALEIGLFQSGVFLVAWVFYILIILVIIALIRKIPYRIFRKTHKIFPAVFLLAAYHGATAQLKERWLTTPGGYLLLLLVAIGAVAAFISLFQRIGQARKTKAVISRIDQHEQRIIDIQLSTSGIPFIHRAGQYAFLRFAHDNEPHPFTIASSGDDPYTQRFTIKSLGDFTGDLANRLKVGQTVEVEGPYGEFIFDASAASPAQRQIWIAGGIGITPFLARLEHMANQERAGQIIHFWYSTRSDQAMAFPDSLERICQQNGVHYYHLNTTKNEFLTAKMLHDVVGSFNDVSIWFCGPPPFGQCLLNGLSAYNFDKRSFHFDDFAMR